LRFRTVPDRRVSNRHGTSQLKIHHALENLAIKSLGGRARLQARPKNARSILTGWQKQSCWHNPHQAGIDV
jgi:hypothetical protein